MDANKLLKLHEVGYEVRETCGTCLHAQIDRRNDYGTCGFIQYNHLKHSDSERELSIHRSGHCFHWEGPAVGVDFTWMELHE